MYGQVEKKRYPIYIQRASKNKSDTFFFPTLTYQQTDLKYALQKDEFEGRLSPGGDFRSNAAILIEIRDSASSKLIWSGSISRDRDVFVGEYMHERSRRAIYNAITEVLKDFPGVTG